MKKFYSIKALGGEEAEIRLYGDIVEQRPYDLRTNRKSDGDYIVKDEFLSELEKLGTPKQLTIHIDSFGGDASVSLLLYNRLRELAEKGTKLECVVDGVAMSAGTHIMCACDVVKVNPGSIIMIHKCMGFYCDWMNADELRSAAVMQGAWDGSQIAMYKAKTGLDEGKIEKMMSETTYMTGKEAVELGFADELTEERQVNMAALADGHFFIGKSRFKTPTGFAGMRDNGILDSEKNEDEINKNKPEAEGEKKTAEETKGEKEMDTKKEELKAAALEERNRLAEIDEVAALFDPELVKEAKYGEKTMTASELAYEAAKRAAVKGSDFLCGMRKDAKDSGTAEVPAASGKDGSDEEPTDKMGAARAAMKKIFGGDEK